MEDEYGPNESIPQRSGLITTSGTSWEALGQANEPCVVHWSIRLGGFEEIRSPSDHHLLEEFYEHDGDPIEPRNTAVQGPILQKRDASPCLKTEEEEPIVFSTTAWCPKKKSSQESPPPWNGSLFDLDSTIFDAPEVASDVDRASVLEAAISSEPTPPPLPGDPTSDYQPAEPICRQYTPPLTDPINDLPPSNSLTQLDPIPSQSAGQAMIDPSILDVPSYCPTTPRKRRRVYMDAVEIVMPRFKLAGYRRLRIPSYTVPSTSILAETAPQMLLEQKSTILLESASNSQSSFSSARTSTLQLDASPKEKRRVYLDAVEITIPEWLNRQRRGCIKKEIKENLGAGFLNPKWNIKRHEKDIQAGLGSVLRRVEALNITPLPIDRDEALLDHTVSRISVFNVYGLCRQQVSLTTSSKKRQYRDYGDFMFLNNELNPFGPQRPGYPGLLYRSCESEAPRQQRLFITIKRNVWLYIGQYELIPTEPLTLQEWNASSPVAKSTWSTKVAKSETYKDALIRISLRQKLGREPTPIEVEKASHRKLKVTARDVEGAFNRGEEALRVWALKCVAYDDNFQRDMISKLSPKTSVSSSLEEGGKIDEALRLHPKANHHNKATAGPPKHDKAKPGYVAISEPDHGQRSSPSTHQARSGITDAALSVRKTSRVRQPPKRFLND